jgi:hypothetical protein
MPMPAFTNNGMFDFPDNIIDYPPQAFTAMQGNTANNNNAAPPTTVVMPVLLIAAAAYFLGA